MVTEDFMFYMATITLPASAFLWFPVCIGNERYRFKTEGTQHTGSPFPCRSDLYLYSKFNANRISLGLSFPDDLPERGLHKEWHNPAIYMGAVCSLREQILQHIYSSDWGIRLRKNREVVAIPIQPIPQLLAPPVSEIRRQMIMELAGIPFKNLYGLQIVATGLGLLGFEQARKSR